MKKTLISLLEFCFILLYPYHNVSSSVDACPEEVIVHIFKFIPPENMPHLKGVSRRFRNIYDELRPINAERSFIDSLSNENIPENSKDCLFHMKLAAYFGLSSAMLILDSWYTEKSHGLEDTEEQYKLCKFFIMLGVRGDKHASSSLMIWYRTTGLNNVLINDNRLKDPFLALFTSLASQDVKGALTVLSQWYTSNDCTKEDPALQRAGIDFFKTCAKNGSREALETLIYWYKEEEKAGIIVPLDKSEFKIFLEELSSQSHSQVLAKFALDLF